MFHLRGLTITVSIALIVPAVSIAGAFGVRQAFSRSEEVESFVVLAFGVIPAAVRRALTDITDT